jgi:hypothetical protein
MANVCSDENTVGVWRSEFRAVGKWFTAAADEVDGAKAEEPESDLSGTWLSDVRRRIAALEAEQQKLKRQVKSIQDVQIDAEGYTWNFQHKSIMDDLNRRATTRW